MSLDGRLSGVNEHEKIRTCTGAPDFETNKMGEKKEEHEGGKKKRSTIETNRQR